jgi:Na+/proline symporter
MEVGTWAFIAVLVGMTLFAGLGIAYSRAQAITLEQYLTARQTTGSFSSMATIVASLMGAWILFSPAETASWAGLLAVICYGIGQAAPIIAFVVLGPRMRQLMPQGHSLGEYALLRYGRAMYVFTLVIMVFYMFTFLAAEMTGIAQAVHLIAGTPLLLTVVLVGLATLGYTVYGGLRASIFTDNIQFLLIFPLLIIILVVVLGELGGWGAAFDSVRDEAPELLSFGYRPGIEFGVTLIIAILAANLFHQGLWQRVYAAKSDAVLRTGFIWAGVLVVPLVIMAGLFGLWAVGQGLTGPGNPSPIALFLIALEVLPGWVVVTLMVLALVLVMSSMDTMLNGIASSFTSGLPRLKPSWSTRRLLASSRAITVALSIPAMAVATVVDSVLYLFLMADLVTAGAMVPVFLGMYARRFTGTMALVSAVLGIAAGVLFFPTPEAPYITGWWTVPLLSDWWDVLRSGNVLASFLAAVAVSTVAAGVMLLTAYQRPSTQRYDFEKLKEGVHLLEG